MAFTDSLGERMTAAELDRHRIAETEKDVTDLTAIVRSLEREVDRLKIEQAGTSAGLARLEGKLDERDKTLTASLARLHDRLDERLREVAPVAAVAELKTEFTKARELELLEQGAKAERRRLWRAWFQITGATVGVLGLVIAAVAAVSAFI